MWVGFMQTPAHHRIDVYVLRSESAEQPLHAHVRPKKIPTLPIRVPLASGDSLDALYGQLIMRKCYGYSVAADRRSHRFQGHASMDIA